MRLRGRLNPDATPPTPLPLPFVNDKGLLSLRRGRVMPFSTLDEGEKGEYSLGWAPANESMVRGSGRGLLAAMATEADEAGGGRELPAARVGWGYE